MFTNNNTLSLATAPSSAPATPVALSDPTAPATPVALSDPTVPTAPAPKQIPPQSTVKYHYFI